MHIEIRVTLDANQNTTGRRTRSPLRIHYRPLGEPRWRSFQYLPQPGQDLDELKAAIERAVERRATHR